LLPWLKIAESSGAVPPGGTGVRVSSPTSSPSATTSA
jgi:hypothetical protein